MLVSGDERFGELFDRLPEPEFTAGVVESSDERAAVPRSILFPVGAAVRPSAASARCCPAVAAIIRHNQELGRYRADLDAFGDPADLDPSDSIQVLTYRR